MVTSFRVGTDVGIDAIKQLPGMITLPPIRSTQFISQRHEVNPAIALNLLKDIQSAVALWQDQLRQIVTALHTLHAQGPMVDGWLESSVLAPAKPAAQTACADSTILRHGDAAALLQYVEALDCPQSDSLDKSAEGQSSEDRNSQDKDLENQSLPTYRLCHLNDSGQVVSQPCPAEQMGMVSMAIARYQKFRQLMNQKQAIEAKLQCTVNQLTDTRSTLKDYLA